jgi:hypothetical protein
MKLDNSGSNKMKRTGGLVSIWRGSALIVLVAFAASPASVGAHGGGVPQLVNAQAGPYLVSAWTQPDPIRVGMLHIGVAVVDPPESEGAVAEVSDYILDADVQVQLKPTGQNGEHLTVVASRENAANKLFYEADIELPQKGNWQVVIAVDGPAGQGSANFEIDVLAASPFNWTLWGGIGLALVVVGWAAVTFRSPKSSEDE